MLPVFTTDQVKDGIDTGDFMIDLSDYMKKKDAVTKNELDSLTAVVANKLDKTPQHKHDISDVKDLREELASKYDTSKKYPHNVILSDVDTIAYIESPKVQRLEVAVNSAVDGYNFYVDDSNGDLMIVSPASMLIATYSVTSNNWTFGNVSLNDIATKRVIEAEISNLKAADTNTTVVLANHDERITSVHSAVESCQNQVTEHDGLIRENSIDIAANLAKITAVQASLNEYITKTDAIIKNHYDALIVLCQKHGMIEATSSE